MFIAITSFTCQYLYNILKTPKSSLWEVHSSLGSEGGWDKYTPHIAQSWVVNNVGTTEVEAKVRHESVTEWVSAMKSKWLVCFLTCPGPLFEINRGNFYVKDYLKAQMISISEFTALPGSFNFKSVICFLYFFFIAVSRSQANHLNSHIYKLRKIPSFSILSGPL